MRSSAFALLFVAVLALPAAAQVFKWVDDKGRTHYGEKPPEGTKASEVGVPTTPPTATPQQDWKQKELESRRQRIERERKESEEGARGTRNEGQRVARCEEGQRRAKLLEEEIRLYDRNEKGEKVYLDDKDRPAAVASAKRLIAENCR